MSYSLARAFFTDHITQKGAQEGLCLTRELDPQLARQRTMEASRKEYTYLGNHSVTKVKRTTWSRLIFSLNLNFTVACPVFEVYLRLLHLYRIVDKPIDKPSTL